MAGYGPPPSSYPPSGPPVGASQYPMGYAPAMNAPPPYGYHQPPPPSSYPPQPSLPPLVQAFFSPWDPPPPAVSPPEDSELAQRIDKAVEYAVKNGPQFEAMMREKQQGNAGYSFLNSQGEASGYYRFRLWSSLMEASGVAAPWGGGMQGGGYPPQHGYPQQQPPQPYDTHQTSDGGSRAAGEPSGPDEASEQQGRQEGKDVRLGSAVEEEGGMGKPGGDEAGRGVRGGKEGEKDVEGDAQAEAQQLGDGAASGSSTVSHVQQTASSQQQQQQYGGGLGYSNASEYSGYHPPSYSQPPAAYPPAPYPPQPDQPQNYPPQPTSPSGLPADVASEVEGVLAALNGTKEAIKSAKAWFLGRQALAQGIFHAFAMRVASLKGDPESQLFVVYLVNDILFHR